MKQLDKFLAAAREAFTVFATDKRSLVSVKKVFDITQVQEVPLLGDGPPGVQQPTSKSNHGR